MICRITNERKDFDVSALVSNDSRIKPIDAASNFDVKVVTDESTIAELRFLYPHLCYQT
jgi:hypothetical protein